jgi:hypothetical protein
MSETPNTGRKPDPQIIARSIQTSSDLLRAIDHTEQEFQRLPVFIRPMAKSYFKDSAGQSTEDWRDTINELMNKLEAIGHDDNTARQWLNASYPRLREMLQKLSAVFGNAPQQVALMTSDQETLKTAKLSAAEYQGIIEKLLGLLDMV